MSLGYTKVTLRSETFLYINTSYPSMHVFSVHPSAIMHLPKQGCVDIQVVVDSFDAVFFGHQISQCFEHDVGKSRRISTTRNPRHSRVSDQENKKSMKHSTMGQKRKKHRINSHLLNHSPMSERCKRASERTSEWPSTPICILGYSGPLWGGGWVWVGLSGPDQRIWGSGRG